MKVDSTILGFQCYKNTNNIYSFVYEHINQNDSNDALTKFKDFIQTNNINILDTKYVFKTYHKASGIVDIFSSDPEEEDFFVWRPALNSYISSL
jgi:hypothetical protein